MVWRTLPQDDPEALRGFIQEYPSSPLAERAFTRLQELDEEEGVLSPGAQRSLASSADSHYHTLSRPSGSVFVATLSMQPQPVSSSSRSLRPRVELGAASWGTELGMSLGAGLQGHTFGAVARTRFGDGRGEFQLAGRAELPFATVWTPFVEVLGARRIRSQELAPWALGGAVGSSFSVSEPLAVQVSAEYWSDTRVGLHAALRYSF